MRTNVNYLRRMGKRTSEQMNERTIKKELAALTHRELMSRPTQVVWWPYYKEIANTQRRMKIKVVSSLYTTMYGGPVWMKILYIWIKCVLVCLCVKKRGTYLTKLYIHMCMSRVVILYKMWNLRWNGKWATVWISTWWGSVLMFVLYSSYSVSSERRSCVGHARNAQ